MLNCIRNASTLSRSTLGNLWVGVKLILFLRCRAQHFALSSANLWSAAAVLLLTYFTIDYIYAESPAVFDLYALQEKAVWFALVLLAGFISSLITGKRSLQWSFPVVFLNALWIPVILHCVILATDSWHKYMEYESYKELTYVAVFVIAFRSLIAVAPANAARQLLGALACVGLFHLASGHFYYSSFWYKEYEEEVKKERKLMAEDVLPDQYALLDEQLAKLAPRRKGTNYFVVTYGSDDAQNVFMKEAIFAHAVLEKKLAAAGHVVTLINNPAMLTEFPFASVNGIGRMFDYLARKSAEAEKKKAEPKARYPLATVTNLNRTVQAMARKADMKEDVLVLYITSHGGRDSTVSVQLSGVPLYQLTSDKLKQILDKSGFKKKVLLISACFSGSFVNSLKDDNTLIITSSRDDRVSYGCGMDDDLTYFGEAFLKEALAKTDSLITAYELARESIEHHEDDSGIKEHSQPQIYVGRNVRDFLK